MTKFGTLIREARSGYATADRDLQDLLDSLADAIQEEQRRSNRLLDVISGVERAVDAHAFNDEDGVGWLPLDRITEALWPEKAPG